jgi:hypothetical protein
MSPPAPRPQAPHGAGGRGPLATRRLKKTRKEEK